MPPDWIKKMAEASREADCALREMTPPEFLAWLRTLEVETVRVTEMRRNWVRDEDVAGLLLLLDSQKPCSRVDSVRSSLLRYERSTVGDEVLKMLNAYFDGWYPPAAGCDRETIRRKLDERFLINFPGSQ